MTRPAIGAVAFATLVLVGGAAALPPPLPAPQSRVFQPRSPDQQAEPALKFTATEVSFGEVSDEGRVQVEFPFVIQGDEAIRIKKVQPSCGCTTTELDKTVYQPGEQGVLRATFNPERRNGEQHKAITVYSSDPNYGVRRLMINGYVRPIAYAEPSIVNFGRVNKGQGTTKTIKVYGRMEGFEITGVELTDEEIFGAEVLGSERVEIEGVAFTAYDLRVDQKGGRRAGQVTGYVNLKTNDERRPLIAVQMVGMVNSDLAFDAPMVRINRIAVGDSFEQDLILRHTQMQEFKILSVEHIGEAFDLHLEWEPLEETAGAYRIRVRGEALFASRGFRDRIVITTDMQDESPVEAYFTGTTLDVRAEERDLGAPAAGGRAPVVGGAP